jgi:hypothetical protein
MITFREKPKEKEVKEASIPPKPKVKRGRPPKDKTAVAGGKKKKSMRSPNDRMMRNYETR